MSGNYSTLLSISTKMKVVRKEEKSFNIIFGLSLVQYALILREERSSTSRNTGVKIRKTIEFVVFHIGNVCIKTKEWHMRDLEKGGGDCNFSKRSTGL